MSKYEVLPQQLLHEGTIRPSDIFNPGPIDTAWILLTHEETYWQKLRGLAFSPREIRRVGFPLNERVVRREMTIVEGTRQCADLALQYGIAMNIAGGTHHAFTDRGEGFCLLNDIAIAANYLLSQSRAGRILVIDLDVHQGNGTAQIFRNEKRVFTFSMHGENNYPLVKEKSDLDIALPDFTEDAAYLSLLDDTLRDLMDRVSPDYLFYQAGVDILATDRLGRLSISREGCRQRDRLVLETAHRNSIPLVISMGGGYSHDFRDIIEAHANTFRSAREIYF